MVERTNMDNEYDVEIIRTVHQTVRRKIKAADPIRAKRQAEDMAGDIDFSGLEKEAEYIVRVHGVTKYAH